MYIFDFFYYNFSLFSYYDLISARFTFFMTSFILGQIYKVCSQPQKSSWIVGFMWKKEELSTTDELLAITLLLVFSYF